MQKIVKQIAEWHRQGIGARRIVTKLHRELHVRPPGGSGWSTSVIQAIIRREVAGCSYESKARMDPTAKQA